MKTLHANVKIQHVCTLYYESIVCNIISKVKHFAGNIVFIELYCFVARSVYFIG